MSEQAAANSTPAKSAPQLSGWKLTAMRVATLLFVVGISIYLYAFREQVRQLQALGYPGIFLVSFLSSATVLLPVPGVLFTSVMGAVFNPFWVALAAGAGAALGELSGYLAGFSGQGVAEHTSVYKRIEAWMQRYGPWAIVVMAFIPNPLFDMAGMVAGASKMRLWRFLLFCWIGKTGKMLVFAYGGATILTWMRF